jgi:serine/threonine protein kinase
MLQSVLKTVDDVLTVGIHPAKLVCVAGPDQGRVARLGARGLTIGRGHECDLRLTAADVSTTHARLHLLGGRLFLEDLQSSGGVRVDGCPLPRGGVAPVVVGMQFQVGSDTLAVCDPKTTLTQLAPRPMTSLSLRHDRNQYDRNKRIADGRQSVAYLFARGKQAVVIKMLNDASMQQADRRAELAHRIRYLSRLDHPYLVAVEGGDTTVDQPFVVEAFASGTSMQTVLAERKRLALAELGRMLQHACVGVDALHRAGVTHQHLDNHSVLVTDTGDVRLIIFDALAVPGVPLRLTRDHSNRYQAPEVRRGEWPTPMSDVYTIGALAYHWACGRAPTPIESNALDDRRSETFLPMREIEPNLPAAFEQVVMRALNPRPLDRYPSVAALSQALTRCRL